MTNSERLALLDDVKRAYDLEPYTIYTDTGAHYTRAYVPTYSRPINPDGSYTGYFLQLLEIKKYNNGHSFPSRLNTRSSTEWQALRYSPFLRKEKRGYYSLTDRAYSYIDRVQSIKELFDHEKEYEES